MRFLLYNIRYGTGGKRLLLPWSGYFRRTDVNLDRIVEFVQTIDPDVVGLVEVDAGSYRSRRYNQAETIAGALGHYHSYRSKYRDGHWSEHLPVMCQQGNAFLTRDTVSNAKYHYFDRGVKRLVIEMELDDVVIFLVHLALNFAIRHHQINALYSLVKDTKKPYIVAGDFNAFRGEREIRLFLAATDLKSAGPMGAPTYPSWAPRRQLDFILHSPRIRPQRFWMPHVMYSDHLPLVFDFEVDGKGS